MVHLGQSNAAKLPAASTELSGALRSCRGAFLGTAVLSGLINILMLTGSFYMLEGYDRVLPSRSVPTLVGLTVLAGRNADRDMESKADGQIDRRTTIQDGIEVRNQA
jgi:hypothetical protein